MGHDKAGFLKFSCILFCLAVLICGCGKYPVKNTACRGKNIICFGDSLTFGYGAGEEEAYPQQLRKLVRQPVINAGVDADTTNSALLRLKQDVLEQDPLIVIVEFCGNDFIRKVPKEETFSNIRRIVRAIQQSGAMAALVDISAGPFLKEYRVAYQKIARQEGAIFVPQALSRILTNPEMKSDFFHPNASGYKLIAQRIYRRIAPYLK